MASPHMMCPACVGHGKFRDDSTCTTCKGSGSVTVAAGRKFMDADAEENAAKASTVGANNKGGSSSRASRKKARKAGNVSARQGKAEEQGTKQVVEAAAE